MQLSMLKPNAANLFESDPFGYGASCRRCHKHFRSTASWHLHIAVCAPELCTEPVTVPSKPATQLGIADWLCGDSIDCASASKIKSRRSRRRPGTKVA